MARGSEGVMVSVVLSLVTPVTFTEFQFNAALYIDKGEEPRTATPTSMQLLSSDTSRLKTLIITTTNNFLAVLLKFSTTHLLQVAKSTHETCRIVSDHFVRQVLKGCDAWTMCTNDATGYKSDSL